MQTIYRSNEYLYTTKQSLAELREKLHLIFEQQKLAQSDYDLKGGFYSDNTFFLIKKSSIIYVDAFDPNLVTLYGELIRVEDNKTNVLINLRPNKLLVFFSLILLPIIVGLLLNIITSGNHHLVMAFIALILLLFIISAMLKFAKEELHKECRRALSIDTCI